MKMERIKTDKEEVIKLIIQREDGEKNERKWEVRQNQMVFHQVDEDKDGRLNFKEF